jgi:YidC/Oxa1 family membrane protein insertase
MEKRTILAVALSVVVMLGFYFVMALIYPPVPPPGLPEAADRGPSPVAAPLSPAAESPGEGADRGAPAAGEQPVPLGFSVSAEPAEQDEILREQRVTIETELLTAVFTNAGGDLVSWKLKKHRDDSGPLEMLLGGTQEAHGFTVAFGNMDARPVGTLFYVDRPAGDPYTVSFYQDFRLPGGEQFRLNKRYTLRPNEYMFELAVTLDGGRSAQSFSFPGNPGGTAAAYTLGFGPQIGPGFQKLDQRYEYRNYFTFTNGKRKQEKVSEGSPAVLNNSRAAWSAIAGKYFTLIAIPLFPQYDLVFSARP